MVIIFDDLDVRKYLPFQAAGPVRTVCKKRFLRWEGRAVTAVGFTASLAGKPAAAIALCSFVDSLLGLSTDQDANIPLAKKLANK
jgi:hypothetical protein